MNPTADIVPFSATTGLASLPMYTLPELEPTVTQWWRGVARHMRDAGVSRAPDLLITPHSVLDHWLDENLLFSQTCGFPLMFLLDNRVRMVATPVYDAPGCDGPAYRSMVIVHEDLDVSNLSELRGKDVAINGRDSQSGFNTLRASVAKASSANGNFFGQTIVTGGHGNSIKAVQDKTAHCAAIDGVTLALYQRYKPTDVEGIRILCETDPAPGLPFVTRGDTNDDEIQALRDGLFAALADPDLIPLAEKQLLKGAAVLELQDYAVIKDMAEVGAHVEL